MIYSLLPCAGIGSRAGGAIPKQYQFIGHQPMLCYALRTLATHPKIHQTWLILSPTDDYFSEYAEPLLRNISFQVEYIGGDSRHASVLAGLKALLKAGAKADDWVLVHDAARPGLNHSLLDRLISKVLKSSSHKNDGGILAMPVADTLKRARQNGHDLIIEKTIDRNDLWQAQTPQMFRIEPLCTALEIAMQRGYTVTDEASAMEYVGGMVQLIKSHLCNLKVTYPDDFKIAEALMNIYGE
jgi:2-C-methyl-D-erythritol 4-phosphate cytidylyltransferase